MAVGPGGRGASGRPTVRTYLIGGFAVCVAVLAVLVLLASNAASRRERHRAFDELRAAADGAAAWLDPTTTGVEPLLESLAGDPNVASLDAARCQPVFDAISSGVAGAHVHVLDAAGREVCSLRVPSDRLDDRPLPRASWVDDAVREGGLVVSEPLEDPLSDRIAVIYAVPFDDSGAVVAAVLYTAEPPVDAPGVVDAVRVVVLDPDRRRIIATSPGVDVEIGTDVTGTALARRVRRGDAIVDIDGEHRYYQEAVVPMVGWHVLAGYDEDVALAGAHSQRRWMLGIGAGVVAVVLLLGFLLLRSLARPLRRFAAALERSRNGDDTARAPLEGPAEVLTAAALFNDLIEDRIVREADLEDRATHDVLTGLPNRAVLVEALDERARAGTPCAVLFLDLDRFKLVNDVHGHAVGDQLLVELARSLRAAVPDEFLLGRFGGDEFVAICDGITFELEAAAVAHSMLEVVRSPVVLDGDVELFVSGSVGIALSLPGAAAADLLRNADTAMYRSKAGGTGGFRVFDSKMREWNVERLTVEHDLHRALERGELVIHYQPIRHLDAPAVFRAEALVRWRHPARGLLYPGDFIEVAEDAGLIGRLGAVVLKDATALAASKPPLEVSVNVAPAQLVGGALLEQVRTALDASGLGPERLCIEVTEMGLLEDLEGAADVLRRLRGLGVKVAIDDFGTGWSSLSWLQMLPVDEVKVDRSFVERLTHDPVSEAIVRALAGMCDSLGLHVVAEGVETPEQLAALRALGVDVVQGYLFGRPRPADELVSPVGAAGATT